MARCLDSVWHDLGCPDPFVVVEGGAGRGTLCSDVIAAAGDCRAALHYVMVERMERQRQQAARRVESAELRAGPRVTALADLPTGPLIGVVLANELLDNLPIRLLERSATGWREVYVAAVGADGGAHGRLGGADGGLHDRPGAASQALAAATPSEISRLVETLRGVPSDAGGFAEALRDAPSGAGGFAEALRGVLSGAGGFAEALRDASPRAGGLVEVLRDAPANAAAMADALAPHAEPGARVPLQLQAAVWVRRALGLLERGRVLVFDYGAPTTARLAARPATEWLRTYRSHRRGHDPLQDPGSADITCDVAFDQLPVGVALTTQADWLAAHGLHEATAEARAVWNRSRAAPVAATLTARMLLDEAAALTDPRGMGAFWVAEWRVG